MEGYSELKAVAGAAMYSTLIAGFVYQEIRTHWLPKSLFRQDEFSPSVWKIDLSDIVRQYSPRK